jgi:hypothetical protein
MLDMSAQSLMNILSFGEIKALRPEERERYIDSVVLEILASNERGVTIAQVAKATGFNRITVARHLENLVAIREAYKKHRGGVAIYSRNGRLLHEADRFEIKVRGTIYSYYKLQNDEGQFIYIQEKVETALRTVRTVGGIMIDVRDFPEFLKGLSRFGFQVSQMGEKS